ncbi:histidine kinase dimerization/phospho-acceptor domain-containing protein [Leptolyngbya sp. FACHB-261]|uniref:histidine kinase dimerization/phospho-acceptor domain-containing protein n=1 Tax=Leptolyngbya sp. FACHB-261 TaxID=2692806 RepID=UPI001683C05F|nr:histidine kinase dimerization/phospho-acceptor domain-containing protein [Leptolyngbya sp. FACHB-261]MBD2104056.1 sensor histidine kinase [Leptolyngbya sp. FACHB-261]
MDHWLLPTLREILRGGVTEPETLPELATGEPAWLLATTALADLVREQIPANGLVLSSAGLDWSSFPGLETWQFAPDLSSFLALMPADGQRPEPEPPTPNLDTNAPNQTVPLLPADPLSTERFCLVLSHNLWAVMVLGQSEGEQAEFLFSFEPDAVLRAWEYLSPRVMLTQPHRMADLAQRVGDLLAGQSLEVNPRLLLRFSALLLRRASTLATNSTPRLNLPNQALSAALQQAPAPVADSSEEALPEAELLQALAHEIRTPLATIQTLTRSLLRRKDLAPEVVKRLESIERECTDQINRFSLIFRAVELQDAPAPKQTLHLSRVSLAEVLQQSIPHWQQQASRRNLTLSVSMPQELPTVVSDPQMLGQMLTGLVDRFTRSLPGGSHIRVQVMLAGKQLKLQLQSRAEPQKDCPDVSPLRALGHLLMLQPDTGSVSLSLGVTKSLFQALGGKLKVRERQGTKGEDQGETLTIFLPLGSD